MLVKEILDMSNGNSLVKHYSDNKKYIIQVETGNKYEEAIDVEGRYTYVETEEDIIEEEVEDNE